MKINKKRWAILKEYQKVIGYTFKDLELLNRALIHTSYANENNLPHFKSNQRLEFLGDAVLDLIISEFIYKEYPDFPEGELTKIRANVVCESTLVKIALQLGLGNYIFLGRGEESTGGKERPSILADALEALIGAIYLDGGLQEARAFIMKQFYDEVVDTAEKQNYRDYKTALQELIQKDYSDRLYYEVISESGPDHDKVFTVQVKLKNNILGRGTGKSKKEAEQIAAKAALEELKG